MGDHWPKYVYTFTILIGYLSNAFLMGMISPALVDLSYQLRTSIATLSFINIFMLIGSVFGSLLGISLKYLNRQIVFIVVTLISTICTPLIPLVSNAWPLFLCAVLINMGVILLECGSCLWIIEMWPKHYYWLVYLIQAFFTFGQFLAPIMVAPFIEGDVTKFEPKLMSLNKTARDAINYSIDRKPKLIVPFLIAAAIISIIPIILTIMYFTKRYEKYENQHEPIKDDCTKKFYRNLSMNRTLLITLIAISTCFSNGLMMAHLSFASVYYQFLPIGISASKAAHILSVVSAFNTIGRLFAVFESMKMSVDQMISYHLIIGLLAQILLYFGLYSEATIWIASAIHGFAYSSLYMSYLLLAQKYLKLNEKITSILIISDDILELTFPFLIGDVIESNPQYLLHFELVCLIIALSSILLAFHIIRKQSINNNY